MSKIFWLRAESKKNEYRRALTPDSCEKILAAGHTVYVEDWKDSIIPTAEYTAIGCKSVASGSWDKDAPDEAIIVGLKALPDDIKLFRHTHIYFAHAYKEQDGWRELLSKFQYGGGKVIDLEFMVNENKRRVAAFGYWAGYVGAALGALFAKTANKEETIQALTEAKQFKDKQDLIDFVKKHINNQKGEAIIIGCHGRSGTGATDFINSINWQSTGWDQKHTAPGGPFKEILNYDVFVNCVLAMTKMAPFITKELIEAHNTKLKVISDVSCDPDSDCNMVPLYSEATVLAHPVIKVTSGDHPVHLTAIDNLPSILPKESSYDFSSQLEPFITAFTEESGPVKEALDIYFETLENI
jgi:alanine dehydrogenase